MPGILQQVLDAAPNKEIIRVRDHERVEKLISEIANKGHESLQVITDFDFTLTRFHKDGKRCESCHGILDNSNLMSDAFREASAILFKKYYPIEIDHSLTVEEKIPYMEEWYEKSHKVLASFNMPRTQIQAMVASSRALLRDRAKDALLMLNKSDVPVLVFSGGLGDFLEEVLKREEAFYPNIKIVSNYMEFDSEDRSIGFKKPTIHMYNKNESVMEDSDHFKDLKHRNNALVLGDSIGDVTMDTGVHNPAAVLRIGFINDKIEERLPSFLEKFDIVLVDDQSFDVVNLLLQHILK